MMLKRIDKYNQAVRNLSPGISARLLEIPTNFKSRIQEIRIRANKPLSAVCDDGIYYVTNSSRMTQIFSDGLLCVEKSELEDSFKMICGFSIHSHQNEIINGYITLPGGHRAGICGTATVLDGRIIGVRNVSSINLRVAKEIRGVSENLIREVFTAGNIDSLLLAGPPASGKTTILRDLAMNVAKGRLGLNNKIVIIDERGELAAVCNGQPQNDIGINCDVLDGYPKSEGIMLALRTLSPDIIVCDEIGGERDIQALQEGANAGVKFLSTIHAGNKKDLITRKSVRKILEIELFEKIALLKDREFPGQIQQVFSKEELNNEIIRIDTFSNYRVCTGEMQCDEIFNKNYSFRKTASYV